MQTVLGANGQIATELALVLNKEYSSEIKLVSRNPKKVNDTDTLQPADLLDAQQTREAVRGSEIAYFTAGLPPDTKKWETLFPVMLRNSLDACIEHGTKFVYFDNTYMYPQDNRVLKESTPYAPVGRKGVVRAKMASMVGDEIARNQIPVVICRAPEFYGPGKTQSITNTLVIDRLLQGKKPRIPIRKDRLRSLIWTPDASRSTALIGNTPDAYGKVWHLPCDENRLTYQEFVQLACEVFGKPYRYKVMRKSLFHLLGIFSKTVGEIKELLPRYEYDNLFDSSAFQQRFPDFEVTTYQNGLRFIAEEQGRKNV